MGEVIVVKLLSSHVPPDFTTRTSLEIKGAKGGSDGGDGGGGGSDGGDGDNGGGGGGGGSDGGDGRYGGEDGDGGACGGGDMSPVQTQTFSAVQFPPTALSRIWSFD